MDIKPFFVKAEQGRQRLTTWSTVMLVSSNLGKYEVVISAVLAAMIPNFVVGEPPLFASTTVLLIAWPLAIVACQGSFADNVSISETWPDQSISSKFCASMTAIIKQGYASGVAHSLQTVTVLQSGS
jgi:hypothetical protein